MPDALQSYLKEISPFIIEEIQAYFADRHASAQDLQVPSLTHSVDMLEQFCLRGGKYLRPALVVLAYRLAGGKSSAIYRVAAGVELMHRHLLALDDMADRDEKRYGRPTLWTQYTAEFANWSDASHHGRTFSEIDTTLLGSFAFELIRTADLPAKTKLIIMETMHQLMYWHTVAGWQITYFQNHEPLAVAKEAETLKGLHLVTAEYTFMAPLRIGLIAANAATAEFLEPLKTYADAVGTAFQIYDDILGLFGDTKETGKPVGNDVREGKKTLLLLHAYQHASQADQHFLSEVCGKNVSAAELQRVQQIIVKTGSLDESKQIAQKMVSEGITALKDLPTKTNAAEVRLLEELAQFVIERQK